MKDQITKGLRFLSAKSLGLLHRKETAAFLTAGSELLAAKLGPGSRLELDRYVGGGTLRCRLSGTTDGAPRTVFLKKWKAVSNKTSYNGLDTDSQCPSYRLFNDWAALQFIHVLFPENVPAPKWLAGDSSIGFFIIAPAGEISLTELLAGADSRKAEVGLRAMGKLLGQVHAESGGRQAEYLKIRCGLGPIADRRDVWGTAPWFMAELPKFKANLANIGFEPSHQLFGDLEKVAEAFNDSNPFLALTHNDLCTENVRFTGARPFLFDFEFAAFRHALLDGAYFRMLSPTCWYVKRIPTSALADMEMEYRTALAEGCPAARDDTLYQRAFLDGCAYWLVIGLRFLKQPKKRGDRTSAIDRDKKWGDTSLRQILYDRVGAFLDVSKGARTHGAIRETCLRLRDHLARIWEVSEEGLPVYPAFQSRPKDEKKIIKSLSAAIPALPISESSASVLPSPGKS